MVACVSPLWILSTALFAIAWALAMLTLGRH